MEAIRAVVWWIAGHSVVIAFVAAAMYSVIALTRLLLAVAARDGRRRTFVWTLIAVGWAVVVWIVVEGIVFGWFLGGDPFRGKVADGRYYFGRAGAFTEVNAMTWWIAFTMLVVIRAVVGFLVAGLCIQFVFLRRLRKRP
jgi:hypothetical protein